MTDSWLKSRAQEALCRTRSHGTKLHMLVCKFRSGTSKTKAGALLWKSHCVITELSHQYVWFCTMWPGHAKGLLVVSFSYTQEKNKLKLNGKLEQLDTTTFKPTRLLGSCCKERAVRAEVMFAVKIAMMMRPSRIQMMEKTRATIDFGDLSPYLMDKKYVNDLYSTR